MQKIGRMSQLGLTPHPFHSLEIWDLQKGGSRMWKWIQVTDYPRHLTTIVLGFVILSQPQLNLNSTQKLGVTRK